MGEPSETRAGTGGPAHRARGPGRRYRAEGWWTDDTLGAMVADGLAGSAGRPSRSTRRSGRGTARSPTWTGRRGRWPASLRGPGVGPGDVVVVQLPNWLEAGITFWAAAYLGAVVVPIVHFYGAKEVEYILPATVARRGGDGRPVRPQRLPGHLRGAAGRAARSRCGWWSGDPGGAAARRRPPPSTSLLGADPIAGSAGRWTPTRRPSWASRRARPATPRAWCTPTGPSAARPASSTTCSPRAGHPRSPGPPWATSSACSTPS